MPRGVKKVKAVKTNDEMLLELQEQISQTENQLKELQHKRDEIAKIQIKAEAKNLFRLMEEYHISLEDVTAIIQDVYNNSVQELPEIAVI